jgi:AraC-like DNA-binding protein
MTDPLNEIVKLLQPSADFSKVVEAAGPWRVRREERGRPFFCVLLTGRCQLEVAGGVALDLGEGDFVLVPQAQDFSMSALDERVSELFEGDPIRQLDGSFRLGRLAGPASVRMIIGYCTFASPDASMLLSLLPQVIVAREEPRLVTLVKQVNDETQSARPGREIVVARLLEIMLIEALRTNSHEQSLSGVLRGMEDQRLAAAIRRIYQNPERHWTMEMLAREAGMSRTAFFDRFRRIVGTTPLEHLTTWRMAIAKNLLLQNRRIGEVASRVGYRSISSFSTAFRRYAGVSPTQFADPGHHSFSEPDSRDPLGKKPRKR